MTGFFRGILALVCTVTIPALWFVLVLAPPLFMAGIASLIGVGVLCLIGIVIALECSAAEDRRRRDQ